MLEVMEYNSALLFSTMKELIEKLIAAIATYVLKMIELPRNPREFIEKIDLDSDDALKEAFDVSGDFVHARVYYRDAVTTTKTE